MKDTRVSLDMIFIDQGFSIVGAVENVPVLTQAPRSVGVPSKFVVELPAGTVARDGLAPGSKLQFSGELPGGE